MIEVVEVPLKPVGKEDVRRLELALIFGTLFRPDVVERIKAADDRLTWLDSLVVAAGALARERAGYPVWKIAEEVGRTEATVRNHLQGKTEAGRLVRETYEMLVKTGGKLEIKMPAELAPEETKVPEEVQKIKEELDALRKEKEEVEKRVRELEDEKRKLEEKLKEVKERLEQVKEELSSLLTSL